LVDKADFVGGTMNRTDAQLVKEVLDGNTDSFGILVRRYQGADYMSKVNGEDPRE
jgi:hypothetical protein